MIQRSVRGISVDSAAGSAILVLEGPNGEGLAIAIGVAEATSIAKELEGVEFPRPLTHDLLMSCLDILGASLESVEVSDLRDDTYFAELVVQDASGKEQRIDSRPSDAIALAVRRDAPIFVRRRVLRLSDPEAQEIPPPADKESWKRLLRDMDPEDFGKYKM
jgi:bifunctional DNase/RNase